METSDRLTRLTESYLDVRWHFDPVAASGAGVAAHDGRLGAFTPEAVREHVAALRSLTGAIEELSLDSREDEIDRTALLNEARVAVHRLVAERPHVKDPSFWLTHALEGVYQMLILRDRAPEARARGALERMGQIAAFLEAAQATLRDCPRVFLDTAREMVPAGLTLIEEARSALPTTAVDDGRETTCAAARTALEGFDAYLAAALGQAGGADGFAVGEDAMNFRLHFQHAVQASTTELLRFGVRLVEEVERDLTGLARALDPGQDWHDLMERLRADHPAAGNLVAAYAHEMERARAFVEERGLVAIPDGPLDVVETPGYLRPLIPVAAYLPPGALSPDRTGRFFVSLPGGDGAAREAALRNHSTYELPAVALHEGYPGHHLHFLSAQQQPRLVRRLLATPLTVEGWALYCEDMMGEEGFYRTPEERFFQRVALLWRAVRVVLDIGLHTGALRFEEAVRLVRERMRYSRSLAETEVRRACAEPAYQLAYAVGRRELRALRDTYRARAGADYSVRGFHEAVLAYGGLPVSLMRWGMGLDG